MPPLHPNMLNHLRYPTTLSLFGLTTRFFSNSPSASSATCTRSLIRRPSPAATRESPFPMIFIRARGLSPSDDTDETWATWSGMFADKGYTAVEVDITPPPCSPRPFAMMVGALATQIRLLAIPFPPVIVASGLSCLLTQSYIEDNPASGLVLVNPPLDADLRSGKYKMDWEWPKFGYEPQFPIVVMADKETMTGLKEGSRVVKAADEGVGRGGKGVSVEELVDGERGDQSRTEVERWLDRCGL